MMKAKLPESPEALESPPQQISVPIGTRVSITLEVQHWKTVIDQLGAGPFNVVAFIIQEMGSQFQQAIQKEAALPKSRQANGALKDAD